MSSTAVAGRPHVVAHVAVSLDGATTGFDIDVGAYYQLAATWSEDLTLTGADTILAQESSLEDADGPGPNEDGPLLAVVDGRGRVTAWEALRQAGIWSDVLALHAANTPPRMADRNVREIVTGTDHVDLGAVLKRVHEVDGIRTVRVDSGGMLIGALLDAGLLDELSLLVHPSLAGADGHRRWYGATSATAQLNATSADLLGNGLVWLRYSVEGAS